MALIPFRELMEDAESRSYAVGYFETWDIQSLLGVLRAAEKARSPVIVGFNGVYLPKLCNNDKRWLGVYGHAGKTAAQRAKVPVSLIFNESPRLDWVYESMKSGFNLVMYTDEGLSWDERVERIKALVQDAHKRGIAVEAEADELGDAPQSKKSDTPRTDPEKAARFVSATGVDALGVSVGNLHGDSDNKVTLDIDLIERLKIFVKVPLVLHAGSGIEEKSLKEGIRAGIRKINIGRAVKKPAFYSIRQRANDVGEMYPGYEVLGSGALTDLLGKVGSVVQAEVIKKLEIIGSAGRA